MLLPDTSIALVRSVLWVTFYEAVYIALYPSAERRPAFSATPYRHGWGWGQAYMPSPSSATTTERGGLDIVPGRGLLAYTLYTLLCTIPGPLLLVIVELLNKILILL